MDQQPRRLPPTAYEPEPGEPYVPLTAGQALPEFSLRAVITGALLGMLFGAANTYLGLKAGLTISTSIPVAVLTVVAFRVFLRGRGAPGLLEANTSQTVGSASSSVASGVLFTVPALFMWGMDPAWAQITLLAMAGGLIGVLAMVPLRRYLIREEHGKLPYPEGMACAEVLVAAEGGGRQARPVFWGLGVGMLVKALTDGFKVVGGSAKLALPGKAALGVSMSPALLGVGYILGPKVASVMAGGGALAALVVIPAIAAWGAELTDPVFPETAKTIAEMNHGEIWNRYVRYIGAGAVAVAGFITLIKSIPTMVESFRLGVGKLRQGTDGAGAVDERTDRDLTTRTVLLVAGAVVLALALIPGLLGAIDSVLVRALAAVLIAVFAFFFVTVSSRIVGLVGVTSNPTSGMTIATLLGTSAIFWALGWTDTAGKATALMVGTSVCIAASIAGDASQDLKTGFVLGATPRFQQIGELVGVITSAGVVCFVVILLDDGTPGGLGGEELPAPQATLMKLVIDGVLDQNLPWPLIGIGAGLALAAWAARLPVLAFAVGVYLPLSTMAAVFLGGVLRWLLTRRQPDQIAEPRRERGILFGSGLVGGAGLMGVVLAIWAVSQGGQKIVGLGEHVPVVLRPWLPLVGIAALLGVMSWVACGATRRGDEWPS